MKWKGGPEALGLSAIFCTDARNDRDSTKKSFKTESPWLASSTRTSRFGSFASANSRNPCLKGTVRSFDP
jgi:hypothetical protein